VGEVSDGGETEAQAAITAAVAAFPAWAEAPAERRAAALQRLASGLEESAARLQRLLVSESGIATAADMQRLRSAGVGAVLVGESLMRQPDIAVAVRNLLSESDQAATHSSM